MAARGPVSGLSEDRGRARPECPPRVSIGGTVRLKLIETMWRDLPVGRGRGGERRPDRGGACARRAVVRILRRPASTRHGAMPESGGSPRTTWGTPYCCRSLYIIVTPRSHLVLAPLVSSDDGGNHGQSPRRAHPGR